MREVQKSVPTVGPLHEHVFALRIALSSDHAAIKMSAFTVSISTDNIVMSPAPIHLYSVPSSSMVTWVICHQCHHDRHQRVNRE